MSTGFDPYYTWLGIPPHEQPPNYYRLLGIPLFEANDTVISNAADQRMGHVRTFQNGRQGAVSQTILNELSRAQICLLNPAAKAQYDAQLQARLAPRPPVAPGRSGVLAAGRSGVLATGPSASGLKMAQAMPGPQPAARSGPEVVQAALAAPARSAPVQAAVVGEAPQPAQRSRAQAPAGNKYLPVMLVGTIIGLVILVGAAYLLSSAASRRNIAANPQQEDFDDPEPPNGIIHPAPIRPVVTPAAAGAPATSSQFSLSDDGASARFSAIDAGATPVAKVYDLKLEPWHRVLTEVDPSTSVKSGRVTRAADGTWRTEGGPIQHHDMVELSSPKLPREYLLQAVFCQNSGDTDISFGLAVDGNPCQLIVDGYNSQEMCSGLDMVDGKSLPQMGAPHARFGQLLKSGQWSVLTCAVVRGRVWAMVDGTQICNYTRSPSSLSRHPVLSQPARDKLNIITYKSSFTIKDFFVAPIVEARLNTQGVYADLGKPRVSEALLAAATPAAAPSSSAPPEIKVETTATSAAFIARSARRYSVSGDGRRATLNVLTDRNYSPQGGTGAVSSSSSSGTASPVAYDLELGPAVDLMQPIDPARATRRGRAWKADAHTWETAPDTHTLVEVLYFSGQQLPPEYVLEASFTRLAGSSINFGLVASGGHACQMQVDGYKEEGVCSGLDMIGGRSVYSMGPPHAYRAEVLATGRRAKFTCVVLRNRIWAMVDGVQICNYTDDFSKLSRHMFNTAGSPTQLFVSTYNSAFKLHDFKLLPIAKSQLQGAAATSTLAAADSPKPTSTSPANPNSNPSGTTSAPAASTSDSKYAVFKGDSYIVVKTADAYLQPGRNFTVEMWVKPEKHTRPMSVFSAPYFNVVVDHQPGGQRTTYLKFSNDEISYSETKFEAEWMHIAVMANATSDKLFVNGRRASTRPVSSRTLLYTNLDRNLVLGCGQTDAENFRGEMQQVHVSNQALHNLSNFSPGRPLVETYATEALLDLAYGGGVRDSKNKATYSWYRRIDAQPFVPASNNNKGNNNDNPEGLPPIAQVQPRTLTSDTAAAAADMPAASEKRLPLPNEAARAKGRAKLEQAFAASIAKAVKPEEKLAMVRTLTNVADTEKDPAVKYALLLEARQLAVAAVNVAGALAATDVFTSQFDVNALDGRASTIRALKEKPLPPAEREQLLDHALTVVHAAVAEEKWDLADGLSQVAVTLSANTKETNKKREVKLLRDEVAAVKAQYDIAAAALKTLEADPKNKDANLVAGTYFCFKRDNWEKGLSYFALSSDPALSSAAAKELAVDSTANDALAKRLAVADGWYDLAEKFKGPEKLAVQRHALGGYEQIALELTGLDKARVDNRSTELRTALEKAGPSFADRIKPSGSAPAKAPANYLAGAIVRVFAITPNGRTVATPFLGVASTQFDIMRMNASDAMRENNGVYDSLRYGVYGVVRIPYDMNVEVNVRNAKGQVGNTAVTPSGVFNSFQGTVPMRKGDYKVLLQGTSSSYPEFSFRDKQGNNVLFYSDQDLEAELSKAAMVPQANTMQSLKGILLRGNNFNN